MEIKTNTALSWLKRLVKRKLITNLDGKRITHAYVCGREKEPGKSVPTAPIYP